MASRVCSAYSKCRKPVELPVSAERSPACVDFCMNRGCFASYCFLARRIGLRSWTYGPQRCTMSHRRGSTTTGRHVTTERLKGTNAMTPNNRQNKFWRAMRKRVSRRRQLTSLCAIAAGLAMLVCLHATAVRAADKPLAQKTVTYKQIGDTKIEADVYHF